MPSQETAIAASSATTEQTRFRDRQRSVRDVAGRLAIAAAILVVAAFVLRRLSSSLHEGSVAHANVGLLALAALIMTVAVAGLGLLWARLLESLAKHPVNSALRAFLYTWLGRYVPGTLPYHTARVMLADKLGTNRRIVAASIGFESVLILGSASFVGVAGVLVGLGAHLDRGLLYIAAGVLLAILPLSLHPRLLVPAANRMLRIARREPLDADSLLTTRRTLILFLGYVAVYTLNAAAFYIVTLALHQHLNPALAIGAYNLAGVIGIVVLFVPSGLGVREAALVALLSSTLSPQSALVAAAVARTVSTVADLAAPASLAAFDLTRRLGASWRQNAMQPRREQ